ncbi:hypothetical protein [Pontivivens insulae]|uniref:Lipoprotein n=1 Tax=Pontivivens insulae TaxID=1639689 RepID=A0A2R8A7X1_9RHOB|nr:hypothetical protein [Pontivivens insulae]RED18367.1 hypothetical protein DFR53_0562 [Pontivivens insulae]SPF28265.1 hypothetical protein POI8812_00563 [Pontivivens insulae]
MLILTKFRCIAVAALFAIAGCSSTPGAFLPPVDEAEIDQLAAELRALDPRVDPDEAQRAAEIAIRYPRELVVAYNVTDPPIVHNMKVNMGLRERGLCYQWADDLQERMEMENFRTLQLHRAIAGSESGWQLDHSTLIVSARGAEMEEGYIMDPWRSGGRTYWGPIVEDDDFNWVNRRDVFAARIAEMEARGEPIPTGN